MEITIKGGKERNIEVKIYTISFKQKEYNKEYEQKKLIAEKVQENHKEELKLTTIKEYYVLLFYNKENKLFNRKGNVYIVIDKEDYDKLQHIQKEIENKNAELYNQFLKQIPLKFVVQKTDLRLFDMHYEAKVFMQTRIMTEEEKQRYNKILQAIRQFNKDKYHFDGYIDAKEYDEGQEFTLEQLEQMFRNELEQYDEYLKRKEQERQQKIEEYERKKKWALEEAKRTGKEIVIRKVDMFDGDDPRNRSLLRMYGLKSARGYGLVTIYEVATPNGEIKETAVPSY